MSIFINPTTGKMIQSEVATGEYSVNLNDYKPSQQPSANTPATPVVNNQAPSVPQNNTPPVETPKQADPVVYNKEQITTNIQDTYNEATGTAKANEAFVNAVARITRGRDATEDELGKTDAKQFKVVGLSLDDVLKRFDPSGSILGNTPGMGVTGPADVSGTSGTGSGNTAAGSGAPVVTEPQTALDKKTTLIDEYFTNKKVTREDAMESAGVDVISGKIDSTVELLNQVTAKVEAMKTDMDAEDILNEEAQIALKNKIEGKNIPMSEINKQLLSQSKDLSQQQRLTRLYDIYEINTMINSQNALTREANLYQGQYDRAMDNVRDTVDDWTEMQSLKLDLLTEMGELEREERSRLEKEIEYERELRMEGYAHIADTETYNKMVKDMGVTAETFNQFFFKDVDGKMYLRPAEADEMLSVSEAEALGVTYGTTVSQAAAMGINPAQIAAARKASGGSGGSAPKPTTFIKNRNALIGAGLSNDDISAIETNLNNGFSLDEIIEASNFNEAQTTAVRGQFVEAGTSVSDEDLDAYLLMAQSEEDEDGNAEIDWSKIPQDERKAVAQKLLNSPEYLVDADEDTRTWLEVVAGFFPRIVK